MCYSLDSHTLVITRETHSGILVAAHSEPNGDSWTVYRELSCSATLGYLGLIVDSIVFTPGPSISAPCDS
jgi:hypothetical protein